MICLLHGYLLDGSGSNLWTRSIVRSLCRSGETVHLVCQEFHPEDYDFIGSARAYQPDGGMSVLFERKTPYPGGCILHKPILGDTLPVYVHDRYEEFPNVVPMVDLADDAIETYLARNVAAVERVVLEHGVSALHANHAVLMSVVAQRVSAATGVPFAIMPHGSAIEYAVRKQPRFHALARGAFDKAGRIFAVGDEMRQRVLDLFPDPPDLESKLSELQLGVDTSAFRLVPRSKRAEQIAAMAAVLESAERGKPAGASERLRADLDDSLTAEDVAALIAPARDYVEKRPDADTEANLAQVDWQADDLLLFVGRLIASKGPQNILAALPLILDARPEARLVVVGHGPLREVLECFGWALEHGARGLAETIVDRGEALAGGAEGPFRDVRRFFDTLAERDELDGYFETARRTVRPDRIIHTGYLTHRELKHLFPSCDVAVFPSVVAEAGPLVFLEALASGCFPLGTYFAGMAASIDSVADRLPAPDAALMKLRNDPDHAVADIVRQAVDALALGGRHRKTLREAVVQHYDWANVAGKLAAELAALGNA